MMNKPKNLKSWGIYSSGRDSQKKNKTPSTQTKRNFQIEVSAMTKIQEGKRLESDVYK